MERPTKRLKSTDVEQSEQVEAVSSEKLAPKSPTAAPVPSGTPMSQNETRGNNFSNWQALAEYIFRQRTQAPGPDANANVVDPRTPPSTGDTEALTTESSLDNGYRSIEMPIGPEVQFGEHAKAPRWLVEPVSLQPRQQNDLLVQPSQSNAQAEQSNEKMATLAWKFDAGPSSQWKGLTAEQLDEYAYKYLENGLDDPIFRDHLRLAMTTGAYAEMVANVEDPLPPLPPAPTTNHFGPPLGTPTVFHDETYFYFTHKRPSAAMRPGILKPQPTAPDSPIIGGRLTTDEREPDSTVQETPSDGNTNFQMARNKASVQAPPVFKDYPNWLPTVDPGEFRQHARTKKGKPRTGDPRITGPLSASFTANNNRPNGEDEGIKTMNMQLEEDAISRLQDPKTRAKNFPRHVFRRIRPWAGCKISNEFINQDGLDQLPRWPTARRAFNPRIEVNPPEITIPATNAPAVSSRRSPPPQGPRRNPRRRCQDPQQAPGN